MTEKTWNIHILGDISITVPADINNYTAYVLLEQEDWCESEIDFLREYIESGMTILDMDAGYGVYALTMAREMEGQGRVIALNTKEYFARSVEENQLQDMISTDLDGSPLDFIRLGDAQPDKDQLSQGNPLIMFPASEANIRFLQDQGLQLYQHVPALNILAPYTEKHTPANLFACSQERAAMLAELEFLATTPLQQTASHLRWQEVMQNWPYARPELQKWQAGTLDPDYEQALNFFMSARDPDLPPARGLALLLNSLDMFSRLYQRGDGHIATYLALSRVHRDLGRRQQAASFADQLLSRIRQGMSISFDRPFVPPLDIYDKRPMQKDRGNWLTAAIVETQLRCQDCSCYNISPEQLKLLHQLTRLPDHSLQMERSAALSAWRSAEEFSLGAESRLFTNGHLNPLLWMELAGPAQQEDSSTWQAYTATLPYAQNLYTQWQMTRFDPDYEQALNDYILAMDQGTSDSRREELLQQSRKKLAVLKNSGDEHITTDLALIRVLNALGQTDQAAYIADLLLINLAQNDNIPLDRPFLPPSGDFDHQPVQDTLAGWLRSALERSKEPSQSISATQEQQAPSASAEPETPSQPKPQAKKIGRNAKCLCGSGKKVKKCCGVEGKVQQEKKTDKKVSIRGTSTSKFY